MEKGKIRGADFELVAPSTTSLSVCLSVQASFNNFNVKRTFGSQLRIYIELANGNNGETTVREFFLP